MDELWENATKVDNKVSVLSLPAIGAAVLAMDNATDCLASGARSIEGTTAYDRMISILMSAEDLVCDLKELASDIKEGKA